MKRSLYILLAIFIGVGLFAIWYLFYWQQSDKTSFLQGNISYKSISSRSEAKLYYPGSQVFSPFGQSQKGDNAVAFAGAVLLSDDPAEKIYQWYEAWLLAHGWHKDDNVISGLADTQLSLRSYKKGEKEIFYVAINNPKSLTKTLGKTIPENKTVFEIRYIVAN